MPAFAPPLRVERVGGGFAAPTDFRALYAALHDANRKREAAERRSTELMNNLQFTQRQLHAMTEQQQLQQRRLDALEALELDRVSKTSRNILWFERDIAERRSDLMERELSAMRQALTYACDRTERREELWRRELGLELGRHRDRDRLRMLHTAAEVVDDHWLGL